MWRVGRKPYCGSTLDGFGVILLGVEIDFICPPNGNDQIGLAEVFFCIKRGKRSNANGLHNGRSIDKFSVVSLSRIFNYSKNYL